jgi:hypothetical protein
MGILEDPFQSLSREETANKSVAQANKPLTLAPASEMKEYGAVIGTLHGFDLEDRPLLANLKELPGQIVTARTTVCLRREMIGSAALILYEAGEPSLPIIVGTLQQPGSPEEPKHEIGRCVSVKADDERYEITAEREIVLRCGDSSITLTRAGKVIIKGKYIISRSSGYNKIKGAAVDIN